jgi:hypothetical protein
VNFAAPLWLAAAAAVAVGVVVAHLFSTSVPPRDVLPTVRFIPEGAPLAVLRTRRVSDVALLLLRLLAVALFGLALAGVHVRRDGPLRVVLADVSRAVGSIAEVRDSAIAAVSGGGILIAFDSAAGRVTADSLRGLAVSGARGSVSAAILAAHRALLQSPDGRAATELVLVSPVAREEVDSATSRLLALWEGPIRVIRVVVAGVAAVDRWEVRATGDDPVAAAFGSRPSAVGQQPMTPRAERRAPRAVRVVRALPTRADSLWARDSGGVLVLWPATNVGDVLPARAATDSQGGIATQRDVVIGSFAREYQPRAGRVLVRWLDGAPAATEMLLGRGCVREVAIPVDGVGDMALRESFRGITRSLMEPCGGARDFRLSALGSRPSAIASQFQALGVSREPRAESREPLWLALLALAVLIAEQFLRARKRVEA